MMTIGHYLDAVCSRIKCKEVHSSIRLELEQHIEDIIAHEMQDGATREEAMSTAITCMGDPAAVGQSLNAVHKPRFEWTVAALLAGFMGLAVFTMYTLRSFVPNWLTPHLVYDTVICTVIGGALATAVYFWDYRRLLGLSSWVIGATLLSLVAHPLQPYARTIAALNPYILAVAAGVLLRKYQGETALELAKTYALVIAPAVLLASIPSLSAAAVYIAACFAMLLSLRQKRKRFALATITLVVVLSMIMLTMQPYSLMRLRSYLNPHTDPNGRGWLPLRLTQAIEQGGPFGQRQLAEPSAFPEPHTDFVFTYLIYRYGWITGAIVLLFATLFILRLVKLCIAVREPLGRTVAMGITTTFALHFVGNVLLAIGRVPILSLSFPFLSYSRLPLIAEIVAVGILLSIYRRKDLIVSATEVANGQEA